MFALLIIFIGLSFLFTVLSQTEDVAQIDYSKIVARDPNFKPAEAVKENKYTPYMLFFVGCIFVTLFVLHFQASKDKVFSTGTYYSNPTHFETAKSIFKF